MDDMEVEGLLPLPPQGPKGLGGLMERLEREALAEAAALEAASAAAAAAPSSTSGMPAYVPGAKKRRLSDSASASAAARPPPSATSIKPLSTSNNAGKSNARSVSSSIGLGQGTREDGSGSSSGSTSAHNSDTAANTTAAQPEQKKRKQPTIRVTFEYKNYKANSSKNDAKHVPIFQVRDMITKAGLLLPAEEEMVDDASSSGGSDDEEDGEKADNSNDGDENMDITESQKALKAAIDLARRKGGPVVTKRRVRDRDEGYDVTDTFVDDSELAVNEPKQMPKTKIAGYCAIVGEVEIQGELLPDGAAGKKGGRKPGSINKPKVAVEMPDGSVKMMSEAIAEKEKKKIAKASGANSKKASASASPAPTPAAKREQSNGPFMSRNAEFPSSTSGVFGSEGPVTPAVSAPTASGSRPPNSSTSIGNGTRVSPIAVDDLEDEEEVKAKKGPIFTFDPSPMKNGKRVYETHEVSKGLTDALANLRKLVAKESFVPKNKFPPSLKPPLIEAALQAIKNDEYDDNFFNLMPDIFPYNRFTMHKMIKREVCEPRCRQIEAEIAADAKALKIEVDKAMPAAVKAYDEAVAKWKEEYDAWKAQNPTSDTGNAANGGRQSLTPVGSDGDASTANAKDAANDGAPPKPIRKFKFNETMRMKLYAIMTVHSEVWLRKTEKAEVENVEEKHKPSSMNMTKQRYAELVKLWPDEWMTSNQLSRELTAAKQKIAKTMNK